MRNEELYHHGVMGMKWGVRNAETLARYSRDKKPNVTIGDQHMVGHTSFKTANGETVQLSRTKPTVASKALRRISPKIADHQDRTSSFFIKANGKKVGSIELYQEKPDVLYGTWLGIKKPYRRKGYGEAVFKNVVQYASEAGNKEISLPMTSPAGRRIYEKYGAVPVNTLPDTEDMFDDLIDMKIDLTKTVSTLK